MTDLYAADYGQKNTHMSAYGNAWTDDYQYTGTASKDDRLYLGIIPAGVRVTSVRLIHHAAGAGVAADLGFEPVEDALPPASATAFLANANLAAAGVQEASLLPVTFNRPVKLVLAVKGANLAQGTLCAVVGGIALGAP